MFNRSVVGESAYEVIILSHPKENLDVFLSKLGDLKFQRDFQGRPYKFTLGEVCAENKLYCKYTVLNVLGGVSSSAFKDALNFYWKGNFSHSADDSRCNFSRLSIDEKHKLNNGIYWQELGTLGYTSMHPLASIHCTDVLVLIRKVTKTLLASRKRNNRFC